MVVLLNAPHKMLGQGAPAAPQPPELAEASRLIAEAQRLNDAGQSDAAIAAAERALALREQALGPNDQAVAGALEVLARVRTDAGDGGRAVALRERAVAIYEKTLGPTNIDLMPPITKLAELYVALGDYERAIAQYDRAMNILGQQQQPDPLKFADMVSSIADLMEKGARYEQATDFYQKVLQIRESFLGPDHPDTADTLTRLAITYSDQGDYAHAAPLFQRALEIYERKYGSDNMSVAYALNNVAHAQNAQGAYAQAEPLYQRALATAERILGPDNPDLRAFLFNLGSLYYVTGKYDKAVPLYTRANEIRERQLALILATGSEKRKLFYLWELAPEQDATLALHARAPDNTQAARLALLVVLRRKGRSLDAMAASIEALRRRADPEDRRLLDELSATNAQLATLQLSAPAAATPAADRQTQLVRLEAARDRLEAQVSARSAEFSAQAQPVTLERVQQALPAGAVLVEFVAYRPYDPTQTRAQGRYGPPRYVAYALRREGEPQWVELGAAAKIDESVNALRAALKDPRRKDVKTLARALDAQVMQPVRRLLGETRQVFLSPDGALNLIPFGALVDEQQHYLVENYTFTYLTSGRDLLRLQVSGTSRQAPLVIADPLFDSAPASANANASAAATTSSARRAADMGEMHFARLAGTAEEAKAIGTILAGAQTLTAAQATESTLKKVSGPRILHVATHGFFLPDQPRTAAAGPADNTRGLALADGAPKDNPLLRSGLALAGANARSSSGGEDGILTALEAAALDLSGTRLVVLSACETGLGQVENGEGVYGLRRALVLAGSESQLMSLWQVSDAATRDLMVNYYKRLQAGAGRTEALRQVQLVMIKSSAQTQAGDGRGLNDELGRQQQPTDLSHPYYWAAFIPSGDWRAMSEQRPVDAKSGAQ